ncbi:MAG: 30S ribosomal protein S2 [Flavobacteriaceae bacterium]
MAQTEVKDLLNAGVHFGHLTRKWNPNMAPYIYMERNGIHIINLYKTAAKLDEAAEAIKKITVSGRKVLFVATKKQAKGIVAQAAEKVNMPYITERWPGGMLTNFVTIRKAVKKMASIDRMKKDGTFETLSKKEKLQVDRLRAKLEKNLGSITEMTRLPGALFVVDIKREHIAIKEARKLKIPIFAMVDTNSDPREVDFVIPSNDDASKSIEKILGIISSAVAEGLQERKNEKDAEAKGEDMDESDDTVATEEATETPEAQEEAPKVAAVEESDEEDEAKPAKKVAAKKTTAKKTTAKKPAAKKEK